VAAPKEAAAALDLPNGTPVLRFERVAFTYEEDPAELRRSWTIRASITTATASWDSRQTSR
jgi:DNA-binding GntR family transcriptional regulator